MAFDPRQVVAAFLTLSMFAMLGNMIKQDHFDSYEVKIPTSGVFMKVEQVSNAVSKSKGPWLEKKPQLKPCWKKPASKVKLSKGFITFSLTTGAEYHLSQIRDAVVVARYLGATLVLPDIRGNELGQKMNFEDMYDIEKFTKNLEGVVEIARKFPYELGSKKPAVIRVPNHVSEDFISKSIEPVFRAKNYVRLAITFSPKNPNPSLKQLSSELHSTSCLAMFDSLKLKPEVQEIADTMVNRLRKLSKKSDGKFVAVDLKVDVIENMNCQENGNDGMKSCHNVQEISDILGRSGFNGETTVYLTQTWWHNNLNDFKQIFPKTYTKDDIVPADKKNKFLKNRELERALDIHVCSESDVFVPSISNMFFENVAAKRIADGRTQIIDPGYSISSDFTSSHISKKEHWAYSCFC